MRVNCKTASRRIRGASSEIVLSKGFQEFDGLLHVLIHRGKRDGTFRTDLNDDALASALLGATEAARPTKGGAGLALEVPDERAGALGHDDWRHPLALDRRRWLRRRTYLWRGGGRRGA